MKHPLRVTIAVSVVMALLLASCGALIFFTAASSLSREKLVATSVSGDGRWEVRAYDIDHGALATSDGVARVFDLAHPARARQIYRGEAIRGRMRWKDNNSVILNGREYDVRSARGESGRTETKSPLSRPSLTPPVWPTIQHGASRTGRGSKEGPERPQITWETRIGESGWFLSSSPTIGKDGRILVGGGNSVQAYSRAGRRLWKYETDGAVMSSPTLDDAGNVFFTSVDGKLYVLSSEGRIVRSYRTSESRLLRSSPVLAPDGTIYFGNDFSELFSLSSGGRLRWRREFETGFDQTDAARPDATLAGNGTILFGPRWLHALSPAGTELWTFRRVRLASVPVASSDTVYVAGLDERIYALDLATGREKWSLRKTGVESAPAVGQGGNIFFLGQARLYAANPSGRLVWSSRVGDTAEPPPPTSPVVDRQGRVYVYYGDSIYSFLPDGRMRWKFPLNSVGIPFSAPRRVDSGLAIGDHALYFNSGDSLVAVGERQD